MLSMLMVLLAMSACLPGQTEGLQLNGGTGAQADYEAEDLTAPELGGDIASKTPEVVVEDIAAMDAQVLQAALPDDPRVRRLMQEIAFQHNIANYSEVVSLYEKLLALDPENDSIKMQLGTAYAQTQDYDKALEILTALLEQYPYNVVLLNNTAYIYAAATDLRLRDGYKAMRLARKALLFAPNSPEVWDTLSQAYFVQGKFDKAIRAAEMSIRSGLIAEYDNRRLQRLIEQLRKSQTAAMTQSLWDGDLQQKED